MGAGEEILKQLAVINAKLDKLLSAPAPAAHKSSEGELPDSFLDSQGWCDKPVKKDPPRWTGDSCVGLTYSQCPADYLLEMASFREWAAAHPIIDAATGKPKADTKGKPYAEHDAFDARVLRAWARRAASRPRTEPQGGSNAPPDIPF
jgi:hypothetical protein